MTDKDKDKIYKSYIYNFIKEKFTKNSLERVKTQYSYWKKSADEDGREIHNNWDFNDYEEFSLFNKRVVNGLNEDDVDLLLKMINNINNKKFDLMDKESMTAFRGSGFCYNSDGKLIIFNER